mmetsp:Transcript_17579/g.40874  ORF Transcript_17579/g.40874 Transcript_17579/m.40874 type:complete len:244 (-) Transcript_17579:15-746(-)
MELAFVPFGQLQAGGQVVPRSEVPRPVEVARLSFTGSRMLPQKPLLCSAALLTGAFVGRSRKKSRAVLQGLRAETETAPPMASQGAVADDPQLLAARSEEAEESLTSQGYQEVLNTFNVFVAQSSVHGWGVFAAKDFVENEMLHESPGRLVQGSSSQVTDIIFDAWQVEEDDKDASIIGLGFASLHNHSDDANTAVLWERSPRHGGEIVGIFYALRPIQCGEELTISYGDEWWEGRSIEKKAL